MLEHFFLENEEQINFSWTGNLGHWYWDVKNNEVRFNDLKALALGYTKEELPEKIDYQFFTDKLHPDDYEGVMQNMRDHMMGLTGVYEVEYRIRTKEGRWKWFYDRGKVTRRDAAGKPVFLAGIVFDVTRQKEQEVVVTVSDNGLGIEEERRLQLFETGEKTSTLGTDNEKGTGLGLPLCRELVAKHGGRIWVESEEGKGSTFSFSLPLPSS